MKYGESPRDGFGIDACPSKIDFPARPPRWKFRDVRVISQVTRLSIAAKNHASSIDPRETLRLHLSLYKIRRREDWRVEIEAEDKDSDQNLNLEISSLPAPKVFSPEKKNSWLRAWCSRDTRKTITRLFYFGHVPQQSNMAGNDEKKKRSTTT